jgi:hypothetical protein
MTECGLINIEVVVFEIWRWFSSQVVFAGLLVIVVKIYLRGFIVLGPDNWRWLVLLELVGFLIKIEVLHFWGEFLLGEILVGCFIVGEELYQRLFVNCNIWSSRLDSGWSDSASIMRFMRSTRC